MDIACIDHKQEVAQVREQYPEFKTYQHAFDALYHAAGDAVEQAALAAFAEEHPAEYDHYMEAHALWKTARITADQSLASEICRLVDQGQKVIAVTGQSHLARREGVPFLVRQEGIQTMHMDVYQNHDAYDAFMHRTFEAGEDKLPPEYAYFLEEQKMVPMNQTEPLHAVETVASHVGPAVRIHVKC